MAESVYRVLQLGEEATFGTEVDATTIYPCDPGSGEFTLNRATETPDEDHGMIVSTPAGRSSTGVRIATATLSSQARFEDLSWLLRCAIGDDVITGAGPYVHTFTADALTETIKSLTVETGNDTQDFVATGVVCTGFELGFDAINAGENAMWTISADLQAADLSKTTATAALSVPSPLETMEGHLTTILEGSTATAFGSLAELSAHLVSYRLRVEDPKPLRPYGSATDTASSKGRRKRTITVDALLKLSATSISNVWDIYDVSGGLPTARRWRINVDGSGTNAMTIDHRLIFHDAHLEEARDGELVLAVSGARGEYDSTLATDLVIAITNGVAS